MKSFKHSKPQEKCTFLRKKNSDFVIGQVSIIKENLKQFNFSSIKPLHEDSLLASFDYGLNGKLLLEPEVDRMSLKVLL